MQDADLTGTAGRGLRAGLLTSVASLVWTVLAGALALVMGIAGNSLALVAFGVIGLLDGLGSAALVAHFRHAIRHKMLSERHEHVVLLVITVGMAVVGVATGTESVRRLAAHSGAEVLPWGIALAGASALVLSVLAAIKRRLARLIPSRAMHADAWVSAMGGTLAVVTLAGTGLTATLGWWWADPVAATGVACGAIGVSVVLGRDRARSDISAASCGRQSQ